jgi:hypothetical protein
LGSAIHAESAVIVASLYALKVFEQSVVASLAHEELTMAVQRLATSAEGVTPASAEVTQSGAPPSGEPPSARSSKQGSVVMHAATAAT